MRHLESKACADENQLHAAQAQGNFLDEERELAYANMLQHSPLPQHPVNLHPSPSGMALSMQLPRKDL
jgi:hypothetical protein